MKEQVAILLLAFLLLMAFLYFTTPLKEIFPTGFFVKENVSKPEEGVIEYNLTEARVWLKLSVTDHLIVGMKNATHMDFGGLPPGSVASGEIAVEVSRNVPVYCNITGNISALASPKEFEFKGSKTVNFTLTLENVSVGEVYTGMFKCYRPK